MLEKYTHVTKFELRFSSGGAHLLRTMMLEDLSCLLGYLTGARGPALFKTE